MVPININAAQGSCRKTFVVQCLLILEGVAQYIKLFFDAFLKKKPKSTKLNLNINKDLKNTRFITLNIITLEYFLTHFF